MLRRLVALFLGAMVLAGCGGGVEGTPLPAERWDPCSITPQEVTATGLDPARRDVGWGKGISVPDWEICMFHALGGVDAPYALSVMSSTDHTITEARAKPANREGHDLEVGGRDAFMFQTEFGAAIRDCQIALDVPAGVVVFRVLYDVDDGVDACVVVDRHVRDLERAVPSAPK